MQGETFSGKIEVTGTAIEYTDESCFTFSNGTITYYDVDTCGTDAVIPRTIDGVAVTKITGSVMDGPIAQGNKDLTSVIIPDSVTVIGEWAFNFSALTHLTIPENATVIGNSVAGDRGVGIGLKSIIIPEDCNINGNTAFPSNKLSTIIFTGDYIKFNNFEDNPITDIVIMEGVTQIKNYEGFGNLLATSIEIPSTVNVVEVMSFEGAPNLTEIVVRGKSSLADFTDSTGLTTTGGLPEGVTITFRP